MMRVQRCRALAAILCALLLSGNVEVGHGVRNSERMNHGSALVAELKETLENVAERAMLDVSGCSGIACDADQLVALSEELSTVTAEIMPALDSADTFFQSFGTVQSQISTLALVQTAVGIAFDIAKRLPYIGPVFNALDAVISTLAIPLKELNRALTQAENTLVNPWETAMSATIKPLQSAADLLQSAGPFIGGLSSTLDKLCLRPTLEDLIPTLKPALSAAETAMSQFVKYLSAITSSLKTLASALNGAAWQKLIDAFNVVTSALAPIQDALKLFEPLGQLLDKEITIPWIGSSYTKKGNGKTASGCAQGQEQWGLDCYDVCPSGYKGGAVIPKLCVADCASVGLTEIEAFCGNDIYVRTVKGIFDFGGTCPSGWETIVLTCVENCKSGYHNFITPFLAAGCYKDCPAGYTIHASKVGCDKPAPFDRGGPYKLACDPGYNNQGGFCYEDCRAGYQDGGLICVEPARKTFKIKDITDAFSAIFDSLSKVPLLQEVENALRDLIGKILKPIIDKLNIPIPKIPSLDISWVNVNLLPISQLKSDLEAIVNGFPNEFIDLLDLPETIQAQLDSILGQFKFDTSLLSCTTLDCIAPKIGLPQLNVDVSKVTAAVDNVLKASRQTFLRLGNAVNGCARAKVVSIPIPGKLVPLVKPGSPTSSCSVDIEVCEELDVNKQVLDDANRLLMKVIKPVREEFLKVMQSMAPSFLEVATGTSLRGRSTASATPFTGSFRLPVFALPLSTLMPGIKAGPGGYSVRFLREGGVRFDTTSLTGNQQKSLDSLKGRGMNPVGGHVEFQTELNLYWFLRFNGDGSINVDTEMITAARLQFFRSNDKPRDVVAMAIRDLYQTVEEIQPSKCFTEQLAYPTGLFTYQCMQNANCKNICKYTQAAEEIMDSTEWATRAKVSAILTNSPKRVFEAHNPTDKWWLTPDGLKTATGIFTYASKLRDKILYEKLVSERKSSTPWLASTIYQTVWQYGVSSFKVPIPGGGYLRTEPQLGKPRLFLGPILEHAHQGTGLRLDIDLENGSPFRILPTISRLPKKWFNPVYNLGNPFTFGLSFGAGILLSTTTPETTLPGPFRQYGDLNGDGRADIVCVTPDENVVLAPATLGTIDTSEKVSFKAVYPIYFLSQIAKWTVTDGRPIWRDFSGDQDGDGRSDFLFSANEEHTLYMNLPVTDPLPFFRRELQQTIGYSIQKVTTADINGDGCSDIVVMDAQSGRHSVRYANCNYDPKVNFGRYDSLVVYGGGFCGGWDKFVYYADFNGDGKDDRVCATLGGGSIFLEINNGAGFDSKGEVLTNWCPLTQSQVQPNFLIADFNQDGLRDLICRKSNGDIVGRKALKSGGFDSKDFTIFLSASVPPQCQGATIFFEDVTGDTKSDLVCYKSNTGEIFVRPWTDTWNSGKHDTLVDTTSPNWGKLPTSSTGSTSSTKQKPFCPPGSVMHLGRTKMSV